MSGDALVVSLNGLDNVGKTTQLAWLNRGMPSAHLVGTIDRWDAVWQRVAAGDFARWWFEESSTAEHTGLVLRSHRARRAGSGLLALEDRGLPMLLATCAATASVKEGLPANEALALVHRLAGATPVPAERRELHILLRRSDKAEGEARKALERERGPQSERYRSYQHVLAEVLAVQVEQCVYDAVLDIGDCPILDVQQKLRECLAGRGVDAPLLPSAEVDRIWLLAGMSEGGKSTVGALLRDEHGVTRLKIGYLLDIAALRAGVIDPYMCWSEEEQAERLSEEVLHFCEATKAGVVSLESAHRFDATAHLKSVWGDRCQVLYIDADPSVRAARASEPHADLQARDRTKRERGADRITSIADHVIDNSGPLSALKVATDCLVTANYLPAGTVIDDEFPATQGPWLKQAASHLVDDQVALVLATGSTGTEGWRAHWSDLDLLVVRDSAPSTWLVGTVGRLGAPAHVKVGVSVFTTGDLEALRVPPRVLHSLRQAAEGVGVLYLRSGYAVPVPDQARVDKASRDELGLVLMTTRRLMSVEQIDLRALYKHLVLLAKILLRADNHRHGEDPEAILAAFQEVHPEAGCKAPDLSELIHRPGDGALRKQLIETTDQVLAYVDQLGRK